MPETALTPLWDENDLSEFLRKPVASIQKGRIIGEGPPHLKIGRLVRYRPADVVAWLDSLPARRSTSET